LPRKITRLGCNTGVNRRGRVPTRKCDAKLIALSDGVARSLKNERRGVGNEIVGADYLWLSFHPAVTTVYPSVDEQ
jgi:hypothetical protein